VVVAGMSGKSKDHITTAALNCIRKETEADLKKKWDIRTMTREITYFFIINLYHPGIGDFKLSAGSCACTAATWQHMAS
jgi:hypothetical protein